jgi:hypothetical protein
MQQDAVAQQVEPGAAGICRVILFVRVLTPSVPSLWCRSVRAAFTGSRLSSRP